MIIDSSSFLNLLRKLYVKIFGGSFTNPITIPPVISNYNTEITPSTDENKEKFYIVDVFKCKGTDVVELSHIAHRNSIQVFSVPINLSSNDVPNIDESTSHGNWIVNEIYTPSGDEPSSPDDLVTKIQLNLNSNYIYSTIVKYYTYKKINEAKFKAKETFDFEANKNTQKVMNQSSSQSPLVVYRDDDTLRTQYAKFNNNLDLNRAITSENDLLRKLNNGDYLIDHIVYPSGDEIKKYYKNLDIQDDTYYSLTETGPGWYSQHYYSKLNYSNGDIIDLDYPAVSGSITIILNSYDVNTNDRIFLTNFTEITDSNGNVVQIQINEDPSFSRAIESIKYNLADNPLYIQTSDKNNHPVIDMVIEHEYTDDGIFWVDLPYPGVDGSFTEVWGSITSYETDVNGDVVRIRISPGDQSGGTSGTWFKCEYKASVVPQICKADEFLRTEINGDFVYHVDSTISPRVHTDATINYSTTLVNLIPDIPENIELAFLTNNPETGLLIHFNSNCDKCYWIRNNSIDELNFTDSIWHKFNVDYYLETNRIITGDLSNKNLFEINYDLYDTGTELQVYISQLRNTDYPVIKIIKKNEFNNDNDYITYELNSAQNYIIKSEYIYDNNNNVVLNKVYIDDDFILITGKMFGTNYIYNDIISGKLYNDRNFEIPVGDNRQRYIEFYFKLFKYWDEIDLGNNITLQQPIDAEINNAPINNKVNTPYKAFLYAIWNGWRKLYLYKYIHRTHPNYTGNIIHESYGITDELIHILISQARFLQSFETFVNWELRNKELNIAINWLLNDPNANIVEFRMPNHHTDLIEHVNNPRLYLTVINGTGDGWYNDNQSGINITATTSHFEKWVRVNGDCTITDVNSENTTVTMGSYDSEVEAKQQLYLTVINGTGDGYYNENQQDVNIYFNDLIDDVGNSRFNGWTLNSGDAHIDNVGAEDTTVDIGVDDSEVEAQIKPVHNLTAYNGHVTKHGTGDVLSEPVELINGAVVDIHEDAGTDDVGNSRFNGWSLLSGDGSIGDGNATDTTFTMGNYNSTVQANQKPLHELAIVDGHIGGDTNNTEDNLISGANVSITADTPSGKTFLEWVKNYGDASIANSNVENTTVTMGDDNSKFTATFQGTYTLSYEACELDSDGGDNSYAVSLGSTDTSIDSGQTFNLRSLQDVWFPFVVWDDFQTGLFDSNTIDDDPVTLTMPGADRHVVPQYKTYVIRGSNKFEYNYTNSPSRSVSTSPSLTTVIDGTDSDYNGFYKITNKSLTQYSIAGDIGLDVDNNVDNNADNNADDRDLWSKSGPLNSYNKNSDNTVQSVNYHSHAGDKRLIACTGENQLISSDNKLNTTYCVARSDLTNGTAWNKKDGCALKLPYQINGNDITSVEVGFIIGLGSDGKYSDGIGLYMDNNNPLNATADIPDFAFDYVDNDNYHKNIARVYYDETINGNSDKCKVLYGTITFEALSGETLNSKWVCATFKSQSEYCVLRINKINGNIVRFFPNS